MASTFKAVNAEGYQKIMGRFSARLGTSFLRFIGEESDQTILDLGCGTGSMTSKLAERGDHKSIVGIDISEVYICLLYTSPSPRDQRGSRMPSSA